MTGSTAHRYTKCPDCQKKTVILVLGRKYDVFRCIYRAKRSEQPSCGFEFDADETTPGDHANAERWRKINKIEV
jgi:hypothetical protein